MLVDILDLALQYLPSTKYITQNYESLLKSSERKPIKRDVKDNRYLYNPDTIVTIVDVHISLVKRDAYLAYFIKDMRAGIETKLSKNVHFVSIRRNVNKSGDTNELKISLRRLSLLLTDGLYDNCIHTNDKLSAVYVNIYHPVRNPGNSEWLKHIASLYFKYNKPVISLKLATEIYARGIDPFPRMYRGDYLYEIIDGYTLIEYWKDAIKMVKNRIYPLKLSIQISKMTISKYRAVFDDDTWQRLI